MLRRGRAAAGSGPLLLLLLALASLAQGAQDVRGLLEDSEPIWHPGNASAGSFVYFRSPVFTLPRTVAPLTAELRITAQASPNVGAGGHDYSQSKLLGAFKLFVNGVPVTAGPGHNAPSDQQVVRAIDVRYLLRNAPSKNVLAFQTYFRNDWQGAAAPGVLPRLQCELVLRGARGEPLLAVASRSGSGWIVYVADEYHRPEGDCCSYNHWYHAPNENLDARARPLGWMFPDVVPEGPWVPVARQPRFPSPLYLDAGAVPALLQRRACSVRRLPGGGQLIDYGQEFQGHVNLSFVGADFAAGHRVLVQLGEELLPSDGGLMVPCRSKVNYTAEFVLAASGSQANLHLAPHEFAQFRWALVSNAPVELTPETALAWVVQHPLQGTGENPFEHSCARSTPAGPRPAAAGASPPASFRSSSADLDAVYNFTAYTAIAASLDVNTDSQTRQRSLCHIDALILAQEQFAVFPGGDAALQRRTARSGLQNDSGIWNSSFEFKCSGALMVHLEALETGDLGLAAAAWGAGDAAVDAAGAGGAAYLALQFLAGVRYAPAPEAGGGLLTIPDGCGGPWSCDALVDWPQSTRDDYVTEGNEADTIRNGIGAAAIGALADMAMWQGRHEEARRFRDAADGVRRALVAELLRFDRAAGEAFFLDGRAQAHAAIHATIYAVAGAGAGDVGAVNATTACALARYLRRRDTGGSSCMTARWLLEALYRLGVQCGDAADQALWFLSRPSYPGWLFMMTNASASMTLEAWAPGDKWNTDFAHPWCASPAFIIPRWLLGVRPLAPAWTSFLAAPQPGNLTEVAALVPSPRGAVEVEFSQSSGAGVALKLLVPPGARARVCLPPLHASLDDAQGLRAGGTSDGLWVDGARRSAEPWGRLLCAVGDLAPGMHRIVRSHLSSDSGVGEWVDYV